MSFLGNNGLLGLANNLLQRFYPGGGQGGGRERRGDGDLYDEEDDDGNYERGSRRNNPGAAMAPVAPAELDENNDFEEAALELTYVI